ncbi:hypothetical protein AAY473_001890, partial [Plecturocebus cupreus]
MGFCHVGQAGLELLTSDGITLLPRLECSGTISAHCKLRLPGSSNFFASASWNSWIIETGFHHVGQAGLELRTSSDLPTLASQEAYRLLKSSLKSQIISCGDYSKNVAESFHNKGEHRKAIQLLRKGFTMLARLVLNSGPQVIHLSRPPKVLGLQHDQTSECIHQKKSIGNPSHQICGHFGRIALEHAEQLISECVRHVSE